MELRKYLPGGLAPGIILNDHLEMLKNQLVKTDEADKLLELLLVGLISYTETFYKSFFAASIKMRSLPISLKVPMQRRALRCLYL